MPKLVIDHHEIEVPVGTKVIEAAERLGIMIPRFCFHPALGALGACRMCAVNFREGPVKGLDMSCMVEARDGMVISTTDAEAMEFRKYVIECLMLNHPHDCPVCDEGGHCLLQDETVSGGHGIRRYGGKKRTYYDQDLGLFVQHEMNRCIHCWRCRRFYQEFSGYRDLGAMQIAQHTYFGRFSDGPLESPFSGNLIDICPTGVYTDKPARYRGRRWDLQRGPSVCLHCSLGCNTTASARYREMVRMEARLNESVNGYFICDRGRFGFEYANHPQRPRRARVGEEEVPWAEAVKIAAKELSQIKREAGPGAIASLGSTRCSLETQGMLQRFCLIQGFPAPRFFLDASMEKRGKTAVSRLDAGLVVSMGEIEGADFILCIGADPINEAPMLALAMRQAYRNGAPVVIIDPRPVFLPFEFEHLAVAPRSIDLCLSTLTKRAVGPKQLENLGQKARQFYNALPDGFSLDPLLQEQLAATVRKIEESQNPVIVCGIDIVGETTIHLAADHVLLLKAAGKKPGIFYLLAGPNAFGAALLSLSGKSQESVIEAVEKGVIKALVLVESDPFSLFPDQQRLVQALDKLELLLVLDYLPSESVQRAHIVLPTLTLFEKTASTFINQEGRLQIASLIHEEGVPISQISGGGHPSRIVTDVIPGGEAKPARNALGDLASALSGNGIDLAEQDFWAWLVRQNPLFSRVRPASEATSGVRLIPNEILGKAFCIDASAFHRPYNPGEDTFELLLVEWIFGTEELSSYSGLIRQAAKTPEVFMCSNDVSRLHLRSGSRISIPLPNGPLTVQLHGVDNMAPGVMVMPRHRHLPWQKLREWPAYLPTDGIKEV